MKRIVGLVATAIIVLSASACGIVDQEIHDKTLPLGVKISKEDEKRTLHKKELHNKYSSSKAEEDKDGSEKSRIIKEEESQHIKILQGKKDHDAQIRIKGGFNAS